MPLKHKFNLDKCQSQSSAFDNQAILCQRISSALLLCNVYVLYIKPDGTPSEVERCVKCYHVVDDIIPIYFNHNREIAWRNGTPRWQAPRCIKQNNSSGRNSRLSNTAQKIHTVYKPVFICVYGNVDNTHHHRIEITANPSWRNGFTGIFFTR